MLRIITVLIVLQGVLFTVLGQEITFSHSSHHAFLENKGQWPQYVFFKNTIEGGNIWVEQGRILIQLQDYSQLHAAHNLQESFDGDLTYREKLIGIEFVGAKEVEKINKLGSTAHYFNYFVGNDPNQWASEVYGYKEFTLHGLYNGIDLRFIEQENQIKYEFHVSPMGDPSQIQLKYSGQNSLKVDKHGDLIIQTELGNVIEKAPYTYQIINGKIIEVSCRYIIEEQVVSFELGDYNKSVQLIIDPVLVFATYNGAVSDNFGMTATYGHECAAYSGLTVYGNAYPMPDVNAYDTSSNMDVVGVSGNITTDVFISKFSADGTTMLWSTFLGGGDNWQGTDVPHSLICDIEDNIYVFGTTSSLDFPIVNGFQDTFGGGTPFAVNYNGTNFGAAGTDIFVAKLSANGHDLMGSTYVGGEKNDGVNYMISSGNYPNVNAYDSLTMNYGDQFRGEIMLDNDNNIIIGSCTRSENFPTQNAFQNALRGQQDGVVFKIKNDFTELLFSSYYGGSQADAIYSVKIDSSAHIVFAGGTTSTDLVISPNSYQQNYGGGEADGFIVKLSPNGSTLMYSTYLGTTHYDQVFFVEIDASDNVYVLGQSNGGSFPVIQANYANPNSSQFIAKLTPDLSEIVRSTVFGSGRSTFDISPSAFLVDICGNMYVSGWGGSVLAGGVPMSGMPYTANAFQTMTDGFDFYLIVIERDFNSLLYATYIGGNRSKDHVDGGTSRFDKNGVVYQSVCAGCGGVSDFNTTPNAWSSQNLARNCNALVFKFDFNLIPNSEFTVDNIVGCAPFTVNFTNSSSDSDYFLWDFGDGNLDSTTFEPIITYTEVGSYHVSLMVTDSICMITDTASITIDVHPSVELTKTSDILICEPVPITLEAYTNGTASTFIWSSQPDFSDTLNTSVLDSTVQIDTPEAGYYYIKASNGICESIDSVQVEFTSGSLVLEGDTKLCKGDEVVVAASNNSEDILFTNFTWRPDSIIISGNGSSSVTVMPNVTQYISVTAQTNNGCEVTDSIQLLVSDIGGLDIVATSSEDYVPEGSDVVLSAIPSGYSYTWSPPEGVKNPNAQETVATIYGPTEFKLFVSDGICTKSSSVWVNTFPYICDNPYIFIPNAFTPNGDGENDVLVVRSKVVSDFVLKIYNRWGEQVFESDALHYGWDGTYKGKKSAPDVYDYFMQGHCIDGQEFFIKGNITLIR